MAKSFLVYRSSAGSGKTFTLVKEYLKLALAEADPSQEFKKILAITFTNKAAAEMKNRIISALRELSTGQSGKGTQTLRELLIADLGVKEEVLCIRSGKLLSEILHNYSDFSIGTIDSFTHRIIRTFAFDLKLPVNFQIETDTETVFRKVIATLLSELGKDEVLTNFLVEYANNQALEEKNWDPEESLREIISEISKEGREALLAKISHLSIGDFNKIRKELHQGIKAFEAHLIEKGREGLERIAKQGLNEKAFYQGARGIVSLFRKVAEKNTYGYADLHNSIIQTILEEDKWAAPKAAPDERSRVEGIQGSLRQLTDEILSYTQEQYPGYVLHKVIYKHIHALGVINELAKLTRQFKEEENIVFISEFNARIAEVVNNEPTPFIYERLGERYRYYLVDEFQDTSTLQWQNLLPLIDNSLASGWFNLLVGDAKQSIYRWRNANVNQFANLPKVEGAEHSLVLKEREMTLERNVELLHLNRNFRSQPEVVRFNNELFEGLSASILHEQFRRIYEGQAQQHAEGNQGWVTLDLPAMGDRSAEEVNNELVERYVREAVDRQYAYSDICVIVRTNRHGNAVANYLIGKGIPVVSSDSLLLKNAGEINTILAFLRYLNNRKDTLSASVVLNELYNRHLFTEAEFTQYVRELNRSGRTDLFAIFRHKGILLDAGIADKNLYELCTDFVKALGLQESSPQYVRFFLDEILTYSARFTPNIRQFLEWWDRRSGTASVVIPQGMKAVTIMTVHASKGLEFPIVIVPYCTWSVKSSALVWLDLEERHEELPVAMVTSGKELEETEFGYLSELETDLQALDNLNVLYVAFTRAVDSLHIISPQPRGTNRTVHHWLQEYLQQKQIQPDADGHVERGIPMQNPGHEHKKEAGQIDISSLEFSTQEGIVEIKGSYTYSSGETFLEKARDKGILLHHILSQINELDDLPQVMHRSVMAGEIGSTEKEAMEAEVRAVIEHPQLIPYFAKGLDCRNEAEILTEGGTVLRPDRVVVHGEKAVLIDYKTGKRDDLSYHQQMQRYEDALRQMGYTQIRKIIVYTKDREVEEIR